MSSPQPNPPAGVLPVVQTPYHEDESLDFETLEREIDWLYDRGADGLVMAMVSETLRLASEEREALAAAACRLNRDRGPVIVSVGAESTHTSVRYTRQAADCGAAAVMAIPPVATAAGEDELLRYYHKLLEASDLPVIVQDASGYVGRPMSVRMQAQLHREFGDRVMYKPEAVPIGPRLTELRCAVGAEAKIYEGSGGIALVESHRRGIDGTMPGADLIDALVALWRALEAGDEETINRISPPLCALVSLETSLDAFLTIEKYLLVKQGIFRNSIIRGPVSYHLDDVTRGEVDRLYDLLARAVGGQ